MKTKRSLIPDICNCALKYKQNLLNNDFIYITETSFFEASFGLKNFKHLTGVELPGETRKDKSIVPFIIPNRIVRNQEFFEKCCDGTLNETDFSFPLKNNFVEFKLRALSPLCQSYPDKLGIMNNLITFNLKADYLTSIPNCCMGFVHTHRFYRPCTILNEDIRKYDSSPKKIVLVLSKDHKSETKYSNICRLNRGYNLKKIIEGQEKLAELIDLSKFP